MKFKYLIRKYSFNAKESKEGTIKKQQEKPKRNIENKKQNGRWKSSYMNDTIKCEWIGSTKRKS